jgi:predicted protein tyrosine phosphatase
MIKISNRLFIGSQGDCVPLDNSWVTVHACKTPCHQMALRYQGNLPSDHPHYLALEQGSDLYLNMIDPPTPLFMPQLFTHFLDFAGQHFQEEKNILIHCNVGLSRAPTLALLFQAKHQRAISQESFDAAKADFENAHPFYRPNDGIQIYLREHWREF